MQTSPTANLEGLATLVRAPGLRGRYVSRRYALLADEELVALVNEKDTKALSVLYERHAGAAGALARRVAGRQIAAEDIVQDAFLRVWRSARTYRAARGSVRTWILCIVHNLAVDMLRSAASRRRTHERLEAATAARHEGEAFEEVWSKLQRSRVHEALETLPPEQLEVVEMSYFSGYAHAEISRLLGLSLGTVKSRLRLGVKKLRAHLEARDPSIAL